MERPNQPLERTSPWPHRFAVATALAAVPLVLFGGSVTTLGAGMAVDGWLVAEGHFLLFFPIAEWFRDTSTFVEHTHRLFGVLVGLFAIATVVSTWRSDRRRTARVLACVALAAVCAQGALGGFRVLENDPQLAFLHGVFAQVVFAVLWMNAVHLSARWRARPVEGGDSAAGLRGIALAALVVILFQVTSGAIYRHALRPAPEPGVGGLFVLHFAGSMLVLGLVGLLAARLQGLGAPYFVRLARRLGLLLGLQVLLGLMAWSGYREGAIGPVEWALSILHVLGGALLLASCAQAWASLARDARASRAALGWGEA